jgi:hypothetical protein
MITPRLTGHISWSKALCCVQLQSLKSGHFLLSKSVRIREREREKREREFYHNRQDAYAGLLELKSRVPEKPLDPL